MRLVALGPGGEREVDVDLDADATAADLAAALFGLRCGLVADGREIGPGEALVGRLWAGAEVAPAGACVAGVPGPPAGPAAAAPAGGFASGAAGPGLPVAELRVVGGLAAGTAVGLTPGRHEVGREQLGHPTVGAPHVAVEVDPAGAVTVADLGSTNTTLVDGVPLDRPGPLRPGSVLQCGAVLCSVTTGRSPTVPLAPPGPDGRSPLNRPPLRRLPPPPGPVRLPATSPDPPPPARLPLAATLVPLVAGLAMALAIDWRFAAFALLSPAVMAGTWLEERRRSGRDRRASRIASRAELARLRRALAAAAAAERVRLGALVPDPAEVVARAAGPAPEVWARRPGHEGFGAVRLGTADIWWDPPVDDPPGGRSLEAAAAVREASLLLAAPVVSVLGPGRVLGIAGDRTAALALARSVVCQLAVHAGPADLAVAVAASPEREDAWRWAAWLPHAAPVGALAAIGDGRRLGVVVVDGENLACGPGAPLGWAVAAGAAVAAVVLAPTVAELPATCTTVVRFDGPGGPDGVCSVEHAGGEAHERTLVAGLAPEAARRCARSLARLADPEAGAGEGGLPAAVGLLDALGLPPGPELARALAERWAAAAGSARLPVPLGVGPGGPVVVDLAVDGPHGLVAGTTGSGKSELLRALVAGLAAGRRPDECAFVLVDYKGGAAFDACARLPHVAGVVTDLDAGLAARALRGLEAELGARERRLRAAGVPDLAAFRRAGGDGGGPLPSLVVVVDEFATLRAELPDFVDALVDLARRGRSLGVHLVLATQRPGGVVSDAIRANCSLRVALRVQEPAESCDVVDVPTAAALPPGVPGRAVLRRGPGDAQVLQVPFPGARTPEPGSRPRVAVRAADGPAGPGEEVPTDLERLVAAAGAAAARLGLTSPTPPWLPPLPDALEPAALAGVGGTGEGPAAVIGIADDPDGRRQPPWVWRPDAGNLLVLGTAGSGAEAALVTFVLSLARDHPPGRVHVHAVDAGSGRLAPLAALPHVGTVAGAADRERQERLVRHLLAEVADRRAAGSAGRPLCALVVANLGAFLAAHDDLDGDWVREGLARLAADGPAVGVFVVASADRPGAVPLAVASSMASRLVFRLADPQDATLLGVPAVVGRAPAGRAVDAATGWEVQVALVPGPAVAEGVAEVAARWAGASGGPEPVGVLPVAVALDEVCRRAGEVPGRRAEPGVVVAVPVGVSGRDLAPALLPLGPGDHVLVAGPPRSGRSTALATVAAALRRLRPGVVATVVAPRPSPLVDLGWASRVVGGEEAELAVVAGELATAPGPQLVLIDDADLLDDETGALGRLVRSRRPDLHVVAAGRPDALRSLYGHVTAEVRRSRLGLLLAPVDGDGDLLGMPGLRPPRGPFPPGRGLLVAGGTGDVVQVALPGPDP